MAILPVSASPNWSGVFSGYSGKASLIMLTKPSKLVCRSAISSSLFPVFPADASRTLSTLT